MKETVLHGTAVHLVDLPGEIVADYEKVKGSDRTARAAILNPGACIRLSERSSPRVTDPAMRAFNERYGLHSVLSVMLVQEFSRLAMFVSLYRDRRSPRFTEREQSIHEAIVPHLAAAYDAVRLREMERGPDRSRQATLAAVADVGGMLHLAEGGFEHHLHAEWPEWQGPRLPRSLTGLLARGGVHKGRLLVVTAAPPRAGFTTVRVRSVRPSDGLSPREAEIAKAWSEGLSAPQIAARLGISANTVRNRIQDLYAKLGVHDRTGVLGALQ